MTDCAEFKNWREMFCGDLDNCTPDAVFEKVTMNPEDRESLKEIEDTLKKHKYEKVGKDLVKYTGKEGVSPSKITKVLSKIDKELLDEYNKIKGQSGDADRNFERLNEWFEEAMNTRWALDSMDGEVRPKYPLNDIITENPIPMNQDYCLYITNDPVETALKSTGRPWEKDSCERIGGEYEKGFITDIQMKNPIAFITERRTGRPIGRTMIRWGETKDGDICANVEPEVYNEFEDKSSFWSYAISRNAIENIYELLIQHDLIARHCKTPYRYLGYSDFCRMGGEKLDYGIFEGVLSFSKMDVFCDVVFKKESLIEKYPFCLLKKPDEEAIKYDAYTKLFKDENETSKIRVATRPSSIKLKDYSVLFEDSSDYIRKTACKRVEEYQEIHDTEDDFGCKEFLDSLN